MNSEGPNENSVALNENSKALNENSVAPNENSKALFWLTFFGVFLVTKLQLGWRCRSVEYLRGMARP